MKIACLQHHRVTFSFNSNQRHFLNINMELSHPADFIISEAFVDWNVLHQIHELCPEVVLLHALLYWSKECDVTTITAVMKSYFVYLTVLHISVAGCTLYIICQMMVKFGCLFCTSNDVSFSSSKLVTQYLFKALTLPFFMGSRWSTIIVKHFSC